MRVPQPGEIAAASSGVSGVRRKNDGHLQPRAPHDAGAAGELALPAFHLSHCVIVHQIEPGTRLRMFGSLPSRDPPDSFTDAGTKNLCRRISAAGSAERNRYERQFDNLLKAANS